MKEDNRAANTNTPVIKDTDKRDTTPRKVLTLKHFS